ncbi:hypothetical protein HYPSUDRAFT_217786 [Hypholoma sublateritium FD-334 SS-4]|uniref:Uncharacterized protein n=1 Tax=Hypholoma sublateritium (strain FD-334 SS-4) TaxID=945553 RepID=A0A0D2NQN7_HYPSF|nr:hypothetical protein HYPSUDRAFT_217786 [Hypholoma sublateritium FD-334 SS-4]
MHFRVFTSFAAVILAGSAFVAAAPASNVVVIRAGVDSVAVTSGIARRDLDTLQGVLGNVSAIVSPLLTNLTDLISTAGTDIVTAAVTGNLTGIETALQSLETQLQGFIENPATLGTTSLSDLTALIGPLVTNLLTTLNSVSTAGNTNSNLASVVPLVSNIVSTLSSDTSLVTQLAPGALTTLVSTITSLVPSLGSLNLTSLLSSILGLLQL